MAEIRIFGPPGCGKTTTLGGLITDMCKQDGSEAVTACSFTKAAARELVGRNLPLADHQIGTLHAFAYRGLGAPKLITRTHHQDWNERYPLWKFGGVQTSVDDPYGEWENHGLGDGDRALSAYNRVRGLQIPHEQLPLDLQHFAEAWTAFKDEHFLLDFTDLIEQAFTARMPVPNDARVLFLDEVQDFSPLELALARMWGNQCEDVYLAGDDDQCLYAFKGATPMAFLSPPVSDDQIRILSQSYRVPRAVHAAATEVAAQISTRMPKTYYPRPVDGTVDVLTGINFKYVEPLEDLLTDWIAAGKTTAILASCSYMLDHTKHKLREWGLPFHNPYRRSRGDWNPLCTKAGTISAVDRLRAFRKVKESGQWWTYRELHLWTAELEAKGVLAHGAKTEIRMVGDDPVRGQATVLVEDLDRWFTDDRAPVAAIHGDLTWFVPRLLKTSEKPMRYACDILERRGPAALQECPKIILGTIHSVKGGEADHVVLFPDLSYAGACEWYGDEDQADTIRRMFYVGMTRAREALYWAEPCGTAFPRVL